MDSLLQDIRYSLRRLAKSPALHSRRRPHPRPRDRRQHRDLQRGERGAAPAAGLRRSRAGWSPSSTSIPRSVGMKAPVSVPGFRDYQARGRAFESMAVENGWAANLTGVRASRCALPGARVTGRFFGTLGVPALLGRGLLPGEDSAGREHVVVLSHGLWQRLFGGDRGIVGRVALAQRRELRGGRRHAGGASATSSTGTSSSGRRWCSDPGSSATTSRTNEFLNLTARVRPGVPRRAGRGRDAHAGRAAQAAVPGLLFVGLEPRHDAARPARDRRRAAGAARAARRRRFRAAHRLRQRGQPAARAGRRPLEGDRRPHRARREPGPPGAPAAHREPAARARGRCARSARWRTGACARSWRSIPASCRARTRSASTRP